MVLVPARPRSSELVMRPSSQGGYRAFTGKVPELADWGAPAAGGAVTMPEQFGLPEQGQELLLPDQSLFLGFVPPVLPVAQLEAAERAARREEDARYQGKLDEREAQSQVKQEREEQHALELQAQDTQAQLERESLKLQAKLDVMRAAAEAKKEALARVESLRSQADTERELRQQAEIQALAARCVPVALAFSVPVLCCARVFLLL